MTEKTKVCHGEHREPTEDAGGDIGVWSESEFRLSDLIQALCELTDPTRGYLASDPQRIVEQERK